MGKWRVTAVTWVVLLAVPPAALAQLPAEPLLTDPAGDAFEYHSRDEALGALGASCYVFGGVRHTLVTASQQRDLPECGDAAGPAGAAVVAVPDAPVVAAPPTMDGLAVRMEEASDRLIVELELSLLDEELTGAVDGDTGLGAVWAVCWGPPEAPCNERVLLRAQAWNGVPIRVGSYERTWDVVGGDPCTDFHHCFWRIEVAVEVGAPGHLRWTVPRDLLMEGGAGGRVLQPSFFVLRLEDTTAARGQPSGFAAGWIVERDAAGVPVRSYGGFQAGSVRLVDGSDLGNDFLLGLPSRPAALDAAHAFLVDPPGDAGGDDQLDIVAAGIVETPTTLTLAVSLAFVYSGASEHGLTVFFATPRGHHYQLSAAFAAGVLSYRAVRTDGGGLGPVVPVEVERVQGSPGWINFTLQRDDAAEGDLLQGGLLRSFSALTHAPQPGVGVPEEPIAAGVGHALDRSEYLQPMRLAYATGEDASRPATALALPLEAGVAGLGLLALALVGTTAAGAAHRRRTQAALVAGAPVVLAPGALFAGRYRVQRLLGSGAVGEVFLAHDERLAREVVLKRLAGDLRRNAVALERFRREAQLAGALQHPNIVTVHDTLVVGEEAVLVMEYVRGGTLADRLRTGPLPEAEAVGLALDALAALEDLHARGIIHRDVKPSNLLLDERGRAKLSDFGVARDVVSGETVGVGRRNPVGTIAYMAPEQVRGLPASPQSDLYALAATLYEALAGHPPLRVEGMAEFEARAKLLNEAPRLPLPAARRPVNRALARGLAKDPELRFQSAAEFARALRGR